MDKFEQWSGVLRLYCWTSGWPSCAEPQSYMGNLLRASVADATWWCKRQMDQAKVLYTMACDVVIDAVVVCRSVLNMITFVRWFVCGINEVSSNV